MGSITKNTAILTGLALFKDGITIPFIGYVARHLGPEEFGVYSLAMTFVVLLMAVFDMGSGRLLTRELSQQRLPRMRSEIANQMISPRYYSLPLVLVAVAIYAYAANYTGIKLFALLWSTLIAFAMALAIAGRSIFHAFQQMAYDGYGIVLERFVTIVLAVTAISLGYGLVGLLVAVLFGQIADAFMTWIVTRYRFSIRLDPCGLQHSLPYLQMGLPLFVTVIFTQLIYRANFLIVERMLGDASLGMFNVAFYFFTLGLYIPKHLSIAILPHFSKLAQRAPQQLARLWRQLVVVAAVGGLICALILTVLADELVLLFFSSDYLESILLIRILACSLPLVFVSALQIQVIVAVNRQGTLARTTILATLISIAGGLILIPETGLAGAAYAMVITELFILIAYTLELLKLPATYQNYSGKHPESSRQGRGVR